MKKKLLITMGCSHTEGYGCWDETTFPNEMKDAIKQSDSLPFFSRDTNLVYHTDELLDSNKDNFHNKGWPMQLGKILKVDKVVNISLGGSANSGIVKTFFDNNIQNNPYQDYDVLLVWLMTEPFRISYYIGGRVRNYMTTDAEIFNSYFSKISSYSSDSTKHSHGSLSYPAKDVLLENIFYLKILETVCEKNNWRLVSLHFDDFLSAEFLQLYKSKNYYINTILNKDSKSTESDYGVWSKICGHMTEKGHGLFAEGLLDLININHFDFIGTNNLEIEMEYLGTPIIH